MTFPVPHLICSMSLWNLSFSALVQLGNEVRLCFPEKVISAGGEHKNEHRSVWTPKSAPSHHCNSTHSFVSENTKFPELLRHSPLIQTLLLSFDCKNPNIQVPHVLFRWNFQLFLCQTQWWRIGDCRPQKNSTATPICAVCHNVKHEWRSTSWGNCRCNRYSMQGNDVFPHDDTRRRSQPNRGYWLSFPLNWGEVENVENQTLPDIWLKVAEP